MLRGFYSLLWVLLILTCSGCFFTKTESSLGRIEARSSSINVHFTKKVEKVYFGPGKHDLTDASKNALIALIEKIKKRKGVRLTVVGHTDESGTEECNLSLGEKRAQAVEQFIVRQDRSLASRITTYTKGHYEPEVLVYSKDEREIEKAYSQNRRVVITVEFDIDS